MNSSRRKQHSKLWRPSILLLVDDLDFALIDFCNQFKKGGLYVIGNVLLGEFDQMDEVSIKVRRAWIDFIHRSKIRAFPQVCLLYEMKKWV